MRNATTIGALMLALWALPSLAQDPGANQFRTLPGLAAGGPVPVIAAKHAVHYSFDDASNSAVLQLDANYGQACLNTDLASTADSGARVRVRSVRTSEDAEGSEAIGDIVLDGISGRLSCLNMVRGTVYVEVVTAPGGASVAAVTVRAHETALPPEDWRSIPYDDRASLGLVYVGGLPVVVINKFGFNPEIDLGDTETVWDCPEVGAADLYPWWSGGISLYASSDSELDAVTVMVLVDGLDANFDRAQEVTFLGANAGSGTESALVGDMGDWEAVNSVSVITQDTIGNVYIHTDPDVGADGIPDSPLADIRGCTRIGYNRSEMMVYMVPRNYTALLKTLRFGIVPLLGATAKSQLVNMLLTPFGGATQVVLVSGNVTTGTGNFSGQLPWPSAIPGKTVIEMRASASVNDTGSFASWDMRNTPDPQGQ